MAHNEIAGYRFIRSRTDSRKTRVDWRNLDGEWVMLGYIYQTQGGRYVVNEKTPGKHHAVRLSAARELHERYRI